MNKNIVLCGVGGQNRSRLQINRCCGYEKGYFCYERRNDRHGARGGSVFSHIRLGEHLHFSMIAKGSADVVIGFEPGEAVRMLPYLKKDGHVIVSNRAVMPVTATLSGADYHPDEMISYLKNTVNNLLVADTEQACAKLGLQRY